ncbi:hypothetical protein Smp_136220 [Schistosoma mansoni]|uniref:hypothetical protein n=1 Tax=Schistosoma mansoni TaxID=6183 RepID=UPI0001A63D19|nr:hypothetical protein Smp_136220 [Schistosoma mansoni]|eukprot:XP_018652554.1 hypothetical protein Smp_136220 [Schistosoma mansoni]
MDEDGVLLSVTRVGVIWCLYELVVALIMSSNKRVNNSCVTVVTDWTRTVFC